MSLINEALKKAQPERATPPRGPGDPVVPDLPPERPPKRKKSYLWGFLLAVIIVGLFSAMVTSFLVYQILGDEKPKETAATTAPAEDGGQTPEQVWEKLPEAAPEPAETAKIEEQAPEPIPVEATPEASVGGMAAAVAEAPSTIQTAAAAPPARPNPAVWARLQELEIRGIMSDGNKVLVHDLSTGKTKSYKPGDILDGSLALKIASIETDAILFEDYGGSIHTKSF